MDKREAKRNVCGDMASIMVEAVAEGEIGLHLSGDDRVRYEEGWFELAEELLRRSGVDVGPKSSPPEDPRQISLYDLLEEQR